MSYKLGFILSLVFVVELFLLACDLFSGQMVYTNLDAASVAAGSVISSKGGITDEVVSYIEDTTGGHIEAVSNETPRFGDIFTYRIYKSYNPLTVFGEEHTISVTRGVVIGYYN